jgi:hypothetical protein
MAKKAAKHTTTDRDALMRDCLIGSSALDPAPDTTSGHPAGVNWQNGSSAIYPGNAWTAARRLRTRLRKSLGFAPANGARRAAVEDELATVRLTFGR